MENNSEVEQFTISLTLAKLGYLSKALAEYCDPTLPNVKDDFIIKEIIISLYFQIVNFLNKEENVDLYHKFKLWSYWTNPLIDENQIDHSVSMIYCNAELKLTKEQRTLLKEYLDKKLTACENNKFINKDYWNALDKFRSFL